MMRNIFHWKIRDECLAAKYTQRCPTRIVDAILTVKLKAKNIKQIGNAPKSGNKAAQKLISEGLPIPVINFFFYLYSMTFRFKD